MKSPRDVFNQYLKDKSIRYSQQREYILDVYLRVERHVTVSEFYDLIRKKNPSIGYATVYRAMKTICDSGLAREVDFGDGVVRYEHKYGHEHHDHLICTKCGRFIEASDPKIEELQEKLCAKFGFTPKKHRLEIFGICAKCSKK